MVSHTAESALHAIVVLGSQAGRTWTAAQLADEMDASPNDLAKIMKGLTSAGIVSSLRGLHGGFALARDPDDLTVLEVISAVAAFQRVPQCPLGQPAETSGLCPLHRRMDNVMAAAEERAHTTIAGVLQEPGLLCSLPCVAEPLNLESEATV